MIRCVIPGGQLYPGPVPESALWTSRRQGGGKEAPAGYCITQSSSRFNRIFQGPRQMARAKCFP